MMCKKSWFKLGLLVAGSSIAALQLASCIERLLLDTIILRVVN